MTAGPPENRRAAVALQYASYAGVAVMAVGLVLIAAGVGETVALIGIGLLIIGPVLGLAAVLVTLIQEKDWKWAGTAAVLAAVLAVTMLLSYFF
ncbi:MAG: hypothetical protein PHT00_00775 [Candidatus Methanomethylophilus sp.]|nr:hypothetical protein [Methanomethylophilus sp.]MDD3232690.1 hypothetical protein [Methanomethylophilus sp.]MDD4221542.1 hypothetical protein [Methanomethylophilus sp.]MDD4668371.1 hypothetical protein [Methanomethylophilus sp.]